MTKVRSQFSISAAVAPRKFSEHQLETESQFQPSVYQQSTKKRLRILEENSYSCLILLHVDNVHSLFPVLVLLFLFSRCFTQYLYSVFRIYITRTTPYSRYSHQISYQESAVCVKKISRNTYCMAVITMLTSTVSKGIAVVAPIKASCKAVLYLLIVVGCTSAEGSEKSQYLEKVLGGGSDIHR